MQIYLRAHCHHNYIDTDSNNQIDFEIFEKHDPIMDQQISLSDFANNKIH